MKKIKVLLFFLTVILIILSLYLFCDPTVKAYKTLDNILISNEMKSGLAIPKYLFELGAVYKGKLSTQNICKAYDNLTTKVLPTYYEKCKNLNNEELEKYFAKNKELIYIELGYENYEDFLNLINKLKTLQGEKLEFESSTLIAESILKENNGISIYIRINYKNNSELLLNSFVQNEKSENHTSIILYTDVISERMQSGNANEIDEDGIELNNNINNISENITNIDNSNPINKGRAIR